MEDSPVVQRLLALSAEGKLNTGDQLMEVALSAPDYLDEVELGRLDWSPRKNWIENEGGLPRYITEVAIGIMKSTGYPRERAIPIAINRIKKWAAGLEGVKADTVAKAVKALAEWEAMKLRAKAKKLKRKK